MKIEGIAVRSGSRAPMCECENADISQTEGIVGDFRGKYTNRQVTLLSREQWQQACADLNIQLPWTFRRANILISGKTFSKHDLGKFISIGDIKLQITEQTEPCSRMDEQHHGLTAALVPNWRAGVCCKVIKGGHLKRGDKAEIVD
jgi:MOSC domain-containing protein YiiM